MSRPSCCSSGNAGRPPPTADDRSARRRMTATAHSNVLTCRVRLTLMPHLVRAWDVIIKLVSAAFRAPPASDCSPHRPSGRSMGWPDPAHRPPAEGHGNVVTAADRQRANPPLGAAGWSGAVSFAMPPDVGVMWVTSMLAVAPGLPGPASRGTRRCSTTAGHRSLGRGGADDGGSGSRGIWGRRTRLAASPQRAPP